MSLRLQFNAMRSLPTELRRNTQATSLGVFVFTPRTDSLAAKLCDTRKKYAERATSVADGHGLLYITIRVPGVSRRSLPPKRVPTGSVTIGLPLTTGMSGSNGKFQAMPIPATWGLNSGRC